MQPYAQTKREAEIVAYGDEHPELSQEEIAKHFGIGRTSVSRVFAVYRPDRPKLQPGGMEAKITRQIREYKLAHPDMGAMNIADKLGYSKYRVEQAIKGMELASPGRKKKVIEFVTTEKMTCFGNGCKKQIPKSKYVHFCEACNAKRLAHEQWYPFHSVCVEGHGRV